MKILLPGYRWSFGSTVSRYFEEQGHEAHGVYRRDEILGNLHQFDLCFLAVPINEVGGYAHKIRGIPLVEISSVKSEMKRLRGKVVSIHPMFGPRSIGDSRYRNIIFITDISPENGMDTVKSVFPGFRITGMTADEHDRAMADLLVKPYLFSMLADSMKEGPGTITGSSYSLFLQLAALSESESRSVMEDTIRLNPYSLQVLDEMIGGIAGLRANFGFR